MVTVSPGNSKNLCCIEGTVAAAELNYYRCWPHEPPRASGARRFRTRLCGLPAEQRTLQLIFDK